MKKPEYLSDEEACTLPIAGVTAWMALNEMKPMGDLDSRGETVLLQGTGGVAVMGLVLGKALGYKGVSLPLKMIYETLT